MTLYQKILAYLGLRCRFCGGKLREVDPWVPDGKDHWDRKYCVDCLMKN